MPTPKASARQLVADLKSAIARHKREIAKLQRKIDEKERRVKLYQVKKTSAKLSARTPSDSLPG